MCLVKYKTLNNLNALGIYLKQFFFSITVVQLQKTSKDITRTLKEYVNLLYVNDICCPECSSSIEISLIANICHRCDSTYNLEIGNMFDIKNCVTVI